MQSMNIKVQKPQKCSWRGSIKAHSKAHIFARSEMEGSRAPKRRASTNSLPVLDRDPNPDEVTTVNVPAKANSAPTLADMLLLFDKL